MATIPLQEPTYRGASGPLFFAAGFRPFFLFAGIQAAMMLPLWLAVYAGGVDLRLPFGPAVWHGHEMVFGFAGAAIGGFLLTAVPNWTNTVPVAGRPLMLLFALWLAGRVAFTLSGVLPAVVVALAELSYLPVLALMLARPLIAAGKARNTVFLPILALFWVADSVVLAGVHLGWGDPMRGVYVAMALVLVMIVIVGGRIVPSFTQNWLRMQGRPVEVAAIGWIEKGGAQASVLVAGLLAALVPTSLVAGVALAVAAVIHAVRLSRWHGLKTLSNPILWVLHLGYLWLVVGLALLALDSFVDALPVTAALHALTAGSIGTMVLGVMSRAALGHSGRPLVVSRVTVAAYVLVSAGTALRVVAPLVTDAQMGLTHAGGSLWALAWLLFVWVYFPVMTRPRADGRPG
ncbi:NnrS family protein [Magnetospirillum aberrantis]|uniref:NnrS family protein n=1 Tax=Magnetospirillum aberrantis SpK TaxID=908842 RepID=A0A7C9UV17_9PROT|nr:NnrS family protein [Magnetospirillum aberrantis]NFV79152.1 NnrS family protein [Magnetospirillum aberrantis SpK]